ncbi:ABC transporter permease [Conexibacter arvalis]|uniref:ABC-type spermidine/putrescine transport system permease subunit II n=1 Tax=Conexibacter arvalis TaxID=912552 RepID=A0A840IH33_9ACTN|nr:ABC transporter permease [Conexibacter arvalis]MBB4664367.1 ABC-type spermidine/putrescine transport system permease subunit II [Conexibacter arvalis]
MRRASTWLQRGVIVAALAFLLLPVAIVVLFAFQDANRTGLPFEGPSLRWFDLVVNDATFRDALWATLRVAAGSALTATAIALLGAFATARGLIRRAGLVGAVGLAPIAVPPVFIGFSLLLTFGEIGATPSLLTVYLAHVLLTVPLAWAVLQARFSRFDFSVEEAARDLGAGVWKTLWKVTLPLTWRAIAGAVLIAFAFSVDEFVVTLFVVGDDNTLPVLVWSRLRRSIDPSINAIATLLLLVMLLSALLGALLLRTRRRGPAAPERPGADPDPTQAEEYAHA